MWYDIVVYSKKNIFVLCPPFWHRTIKSLGFLSGENPKGIFFFNVDKMTLGLHLGMGTSCQGNQFGV